jgi:hypothetical protein
VLREIRNAFKIFVVRPERTRPPGRPTHRWSHREIWWEGVGVIHVAEDRDQWWGAVTISMNFQVLKQFSK